MPIVINTEQSPVAWNSAQIDVISKLLQIPLRSRLGSEYHCVRHHSHNEQCCLALDSDSLQRLVHGTVSGATVIINVVRKKDPTGLLERWILSVDKSDQEDNDDNDDNDSSHIQSDSDVILLLQSVYTYTRSMPIHGLLEKGIASKLQLAASVILSHRTSVAYHCSTGTPTSCEFPQDTVLKAHQFQPGISTPLGRITLKVVYSEHVKMAPTDSVGADTFVNQFSARLRLEEMPAVTTTSFLTPVSIPRGGGHHATSSSPALAPTHVSMRRLSRLSLSAMEQDPSQEEPDDLNIQSSPISIPIPMPRMQYTHHGHMGPRTVAYSTSPSSTPSRSAHRPHSAWLLSSQRRSSVGSIDHLCGSFVGSYEESLLSGRMSMMPSKPIMFRAQIGVLGYGNCKPSLKCPPHLNLTFPASFYDLPDDDAALSTPYVGTVDMLGHPYRLPPKGQLQILIKNPNKAAIKLFLIPYDVTEMPKRTKTFLRQKSYAIQEEGNQGRQSLRCAIQLHICRTERKRVYLYKHIRVVFANRMTDSREKLNVSCEGPKEPVYVPLMPADIEMLQFKP